MSNISSV